MVWLHGEQDTAQSLLHNNGRLQELTNFSKVAVQEKQMLTYGQKRRKVKQVRKRVLQVTPKEELHLHRDIKQKVKRQIRNKYKSGLSQMMFGQTMSYVMVTIGGGNLMKSMMQC